MTTPASSKRRARSDLGILFADTSIQDLQARAAQNRVKPSATATLNYVSPLTAIHQSIQRQYPVVAASSNKAVRTMVDDSDDDNNNAYVSNQGVSSDHEWLVHTPHRKRNFTTAENIEDFTRATSTPHTDAPEDLGTCTCRTSILGDKSPDVSRHLRNSTNCPRCGKRRPPEAILARRRRRGSLRNAGVSNQELFAEPQHAEALLQTTPQLRYISLASTDMQVSGHALHGNVFQRILPAVLEHGQSILNNNNVSADHRNTDTISGHPDPGLEYKECLYRDRINQQAAVELASLLWTLAHEITFEDYGAVEAGVFGQVFHMVHTRSEPIEYRIAGLAALDALLAAPSADDEKKAIKFANTLSDGLRAPYADYGSLSATSRALGHMATRASNVDLVESEVTRALEWLRNDRSDRRLAACLCLKEMAIHAPTTFHSKTSQSSLVQSGSNEFLDHIFQAIRDPQPIVRACAADALSQCLKILVERRHSSLTGLLCQVYSALMKGLRMDASKKRSQSAIAADDATHHGCLLVVSTMITYTGDFMLPRFEEVTRAVLDFANSPKALIRLEVTRLIPRLAGRCPRVFGRRYLDESLEFLMKLAVSPTPSRVGVDLRPTAYTSLGQMILALLDEETGQVIGGTDLPTLKISDDPEQGKIVELKPHGIIFDKLGDIFELVRSGLEAATENQDEVLSPALHCGASLVAALGDLARPFLSALIDDMFRTGLSNDLFQCLQSIAQCAPEQQSLIESRMLQEVSICLAGVKGAHDSLSLVFQNRHYHDQSSHAAAVTVNMSDSPADVRLLVLSLQTLAWFSGTLRKSSHSESGVPLLPFLQRVVARYLGHPASDVRKAASLTCCTLLIPRGVSRPSQVGGHTGAIVGDVLEMLLRVAVSDSSGQVRLCVVRALEQRYDMFLCQRRHLQHLFLLLQDDMLSTRVAGLRLLGRLAAMNPASVLPFLRKYLRDLVVELQCGVDTGRGREEAIKMLVIFLKAKPLQRLAQPILASLVRSLPLDGSGPPRLASTSLEAIGEIAQATGSALKPWVKEIVPHVLSIMQDQSSASKQRTSLKTLGQIAGSTGYVVRPYLDYPTILPQATDILPATKRAPWSLRREVLRTLGILGALDPDRYHASALKVRKGGAVGGAYFEETDQVDRAHLESTEVQQRDGDLHAEYSVHDEQETSVASEDQPAYLFMYEQYAMCAQPVSDLQPPKRMTPADEDFYPTVAIQALMRIFHDPNLAVHHHMVISAVMFIFKSMGLGSVPFLNKVVPDMIRTIRVVESNSFRETMLKHLATLSLIVREHLRPYAADVFDVVEIFWSSRHLATIFNLISNISVGVPDAFRVFVPRLTRRLISTFDEMRIADWSESESDIGLRRDGIERLNLLLDSLTLLKDVLVDYLHVLMPPLLKLTDALASLGSNRNLQSTLDKRLVDVTVLAMWTLSTLIESHSVTRGSPRIHVDEFRKQLGSSESSEIGLPSRAVQPLVHILLKKPPRSPLVSMALVETLTNCAKLIGVPEWLRTYDLVVHDAIVSWQNTFPISSSGHMHSTSLRGDDDVKSCLAFYDRFVEELLDPPSTSNDVSPSATLDFLGRPRQEDALAYGVSIDSPDVYDQGTNQGMTGTYRHPVNQTNLQQSWNVTQRASRDDWDEWMRKFAIQLLREAPSPALRSCVNLAHAYQPLARELFSAAFACCWKELSDPFRVSLIHALETVFVADVSPEILQTLLNLAEFMEHHPDGGLPIAVPVLAELALKCRAYAKALHYKEKEYLSSVGSNACVESLISINKKLDLEEAALGALKASSIDLSPTKSVPLAEKFSRHQSYDMFYSVIWSTDPRERHRVGAIDLSSREELWLAKLGSWNEALSVYERKLNEDPDDFEALLGCMRCLGARGEWKRVLDIARSNWGTLGSYAHHSDFHFHATNSRSRRKAARICAQAASRLRRWDELERYAGQLDAPTFKTNNNPSLGSTFDFHGSFYNAILHINRSEWTSAAESIDNARKAMDGRLTALMAESYGRAYPSMVSAQALAEMEEIINFRKLEERASSVSSRHPANRPDVSAARAHLLSLWKDRLAGCRADAEVYSSIFEVRSLILGPDEAVDDVLTLSELSRQAQRFKYAERVVMEPLEALGADLDGPAFGFNVPQYLMMGTNENFNKSSSANIIHRLVSGNLSDITTDYTADHEQFVSSMLSQVGGPQRLNIQHRLYFAYLKHLWFTEQKQDALKRLSKLCDVVDMVARFQAEQDTSIRISCWLELGDWKVSNASTPGSFLPEALQAEALSAYKRATLLENCGYKAWHSWALLNFRIALQMEGNEDSPRLDTLRIARNDKLLRNHLVSSVNGFVNAIRLGSRKWSASVQQDLLNLLTCLFKYGTVQDVASVINESIGAVALEAWLGVLPQLLARIHIKNPSIRSVLHPLLVRLGEKHPQALMYPLSVLLNSPVTERKASAESLMNSLKKHSSGLVEEAQMVSTELIRVAILWLEQWHEGLEEASRVYFGESNISGMLEILLPLHVMIEKGAQTRCEADFLENYGSELAQAHVFMKTYARLVNENGSAIVPGGNGIANEEAESVLHSAWEIYYKVFRQINKALPSLRKVDLKLCSPALSGAKALELGVPGTYNISGTYVKIDRVSSSVEVINSKQRPRKITMRGSDGRNYVFLLKGHEDLRQDERVMQLFGLMNALLVRQPQTKKHDLRIQRYAISALSHNCGVVGWVPHSDTMHVLIRDYRQAKKIPLNMENRDMSRITTDYDLLTTMQKVEVFSEALRKSEGRGNDLYEILWLKSSNSEEWLERRTKFTRSQAVMCMVGYILGLGDRHPSNLMLDKVSGRILHIDFGDCFEVAMKREKFPEKVPFRLTRMLIKAMEVSGIEGSYRSTCERTMSVLRGSRDSLVTMLEAFVYDPLISWRLADLSIISGGSSEDTDSGVPISDSSRGYRDDSESGTPAAPPRAGEALGSLAQGSSRQDGSLRSKSHQIFSEIQSLAAETSADRRIASIAADNQVGSAVVGGSASRSRAERSMRQKELMSFLMGKDGGAHEEAINEKALKVIRRVQDKLSGTDFPDCTSEPLDVPEQVQRLIAQATSTENLCQLFIGWCSFW